MRKSQKESSNRGWKTKTWNAGIEWRYRRVQQLYCCPNGLRC